MTTLISWLAVDQRGPSSLYLAADSKITWQRIGSWDLARKLFAARKLPHMLGYCGDVLFPSQTLGQLVEMIDYDLLGPGEQSPEQFGQQVSAALSSAIATYPAAVAQDFTVLHAMRAGEGMKSTFHVFSTQFRNRSVFDFRELKLPSHSDVVTALGSGEAAFRKAHRRWAAGEVGGTSRAVFSAFAEALEDAADLQSGGPPQLVGLYREGGGATFGVIWRERRYFYGTEVTAPVDPAVVKWHNSLFEICDPISLRRRDGAQAQPRPRSHRGVGQE